MFAVMSMPGTTELIIILVIIIIFFGVGKLPQVLGQMGKGVRSFKDGMREEDERNLKELASDEEVSEAEEVRARKKTLS